jgi:hypothetical protein
VFASTYGSGELDPARIVPAAHRPIASSSPPSQTSTPVRATPPSPLRARGRASACRGCGRC